MGTIKRIIQMAMFLVMMFASVLEAAPLMSLAQPAIEPSPLDSLEVNGEGNITFLMSERNGVEVSGDNRFKVSVAMSKVDLKNVDIAGVKVQDARNGYADVTNKFDVSYLGAPDFMVIVQQKETEPLPGDMRYQVYIPVVVTENSPETNPNNGFLVNMNSEGDAVANGDSSDYTYTLTLTPLYAVNDTNTSVPGTGGTAIPNITTNDTLDGNPVELGTDVNITNVTNNTPNLAIDPSTGEVTVPAGTPEGTYIETYTLCEIAYPNHCSDANITVMVTAALVDGIDDNNDSVLGSAGGEVINDITDNDTLDGGRVILGTDVTIESVTNTTPLVVDITTGSVTVPAGTAAGTYTETYTLCEVLNPTNCDDANITVTVVDDPDFRPILTVYGGIVYGEGVHAFSFDTLVKNVISTSNYDVIQPLRITIPKNDALILSFDPAMTLFKGQDVQNNLWSFDDSDPFDYILTYTGVEMPTNRTRFALQGTLEVQAGEVGKFILETTITSGTGGDSNINNNSDRETLQKRLP